MTLDSLLETILPTAAELGIKLALSLLLLPISFRLITLVTRRLERRLMGGHRPTDKTLTTAVFYVIRTLLKVLVVLCLVGYLGFDISGITALIASLGVGIGLAVNGALANLVGGAILLLTRPFRIDDFIEAQGHVGTVEDIHMTATRLRTPDNRIVYIPNGSLSAGTIVNLSEKELRRVDMVFSVGYITDLARAKDVIHRVIASQDKVRHEPAPFVRMSEALAHGMQITARVWVKNEDYWDVYYDILEAVRTAFEAEGIAPPRQALDVHMTESNP